MEGPSSNASGGPAARPPKQCSSQRPDRGGRPNAKSSQIKRQSITYFMSSVLGLALVCCDSGVRATTAAGMGSDHDKVSVG